MTEIHDKLKNSSSSIEAEIYMLRNKIKDENAIPLDIVDRLKVIEDNAHILFREISCNVVITQKP